VYLPFVLTKRGQIEIKGENLLAESLNIIATRRDATLYKYDDVYRMIEDSYLGGLNYYNGEYLDQHPKESEVAFKKRHLRSTYYNNIAPLVDMLTGFLYSNAPTRAELPDTKFFDNASGGLSFSEIMKTICKYSLLLPIGILIDNVVFDAEEVQSKYDEEVKNINPFLVIYKPYQIRDFNYIDGVLQWVLLDNTYIDKDDYLQDAKEIIEYRLWTQDEFIDYRIDAQEKVVSVVETDRQYHNLGIVPFRMCNWQDDNNDFVGESFFEDPCWIAKKIYNYMSYMDEMLASGTFKMLAYPSPDGAVPKLLQEGGIGPLSFVPFDSTSSHEPKFIGAELGDMASFLSAITFAYEQLMSIFGLEVEENKNIAQSGTAKELNFEKLKSVLNNGAISLEKTEKWIFETVGLWRGESSDYDVTYKKDFLTKDVDEKIRRYMELKLLGPYNYFNKILDKLIVSTSLSGDIEPDEMENIINEIELSKIKKNELSKGDADG